ncbi:MAG: Acyl-CoA dehydrogenase, partial [Moraxellaceae bacterium]|nr:Acyl-CoA dehydrogenase [Moraxellaceae bacterium]
AYSPRCLDYQARIRQFIREVVEPREQAYHDALKAAPWQQPAVMEEMKAKAREAGLWNLFLPDAEWAVGLSNLEYAPLAEETGRHPMLPEIFNCNAPDTGNMEVLVKYGTPEQQAQWLKPMLRGEIRSAFCMTEPAVASSDATNMQATAVVEGDEIVINGRKWWSSGIGHPHCKFVIFMGLTDTDPDAPKHQRHSMVLVPLDTPGIKVERMLPSFGKFDEPFGHGEVTFTNVRVPVANFIAGPGRGFEVAQGRLGPGRIHHCMRAIGAAERALELLCKRAASRTAFGKPLALLGSNPDTIANARMDIEMARLLTLKAAWMMDQVGSKGAMSEISQIKVVAPKTALAVIDAAIQVHGGAGMSDDTPLSALFAYCRAMRIFDGPDEVHRRVIAKIEMAKYLPKGTGH